MKVSGGKASLSEEHRGCQWSPSLQTALTAQAEPGKHRPRDACSRVHPTTWQGARWDSITSILHEKKWGLGWFGNPLAPELVSDRVGTQPQLPLPGFQPLLSAPSRGRCAEEEQLLEAPTGNKWDNDTPQIAPGPERAAAAPALPVCPDGS